jgi:hypothetical protein
MEIRPEISKGRRKIEISSPLFQFPAGFAKRQTTFHISGQLYGNPPGNLKRRLTFKKVV